MVRSEAPDGAANLGKHRAPDADAQTAFIPRITDTSPDGVPGGPLAPPVGLGGGPTTWPPPGPAALPPSWAGAAAGPPAAPAPLPAPAPVPASPSTAET